ncbi:MAG: hypothetical protein NXI25_11110, partial [bacterium]|nr:hypothetical protein [bacterium]
PGQSEDEVVRGRSWSRIRLPTLQKATLAGEAPGSGFLGRPLTVSCGGDERCRSVWHARLGRDN